MSSEEVFHDVHLAIYDLSHGMARSLSSQFLGPNHSIDIIPHSGVVVFNREYFFGGGIQVESPMKFRASYGMQPVQTIYMGKTRVSQQQFEHWCATVAAAEYTPSSYDLLNKNCNNFADFALRDGLLLNVGVPDWVLDVPQTFLSSPLGSMMRPMLQNMQMRAPPVNGSSLVGASPSFGQTTPSPPSRSKPNPSTPAINPWADTTSKSTTDFSNSTPFMEKVSNATTAASVKSNSTPLLDSYTRPLLSTNDAAVPLCISKLRQATDHLSLENDEKEKIIESLDKLKEELISRTPKGSTVTASIYPFLYPYLQLVQSEELPRNYSSTITFSCMLLRLIVLHEPSTPDDEQQSVTSLIRLIAQNLVSADRKTFNSNAARSMAWCVLSNSFAHPSILGSLLAPCHSNEPSVDQLVEVAMADIVPTRQSKEVRQAASAFLYNLTLHLSASKVSDNDERDSMPDVMVTLLCGVLDGLLEESDDTTKSGRILVAAMVVKVYSNMALQLMIDLGFVDLLRSIQEGEKSKALATELCTLLV